MMASWSMITKIQRYSIHDGDGIRTTVFFKGCPLRCTWCHNPETQDYKKQLMHDKERCVNCLKCVEICPHNAIQIREDKVYMNETKCQACGICMDACVLNLRKVMGEDYTVRALVKELQKDQMFYEQSGGGVTLSGGEVMTMDMDYIEQLVKALWKKGIAINIDTCGQAPYEHYQRISPYIDTFLYDIKAMDEETHKQHMGVGNQLILENLRKLSNEGAKIYIRIPVIRSVNGSINEMKSIIDYLLDHSIHVAQVHLLPYHKIGSGKYERIGMTYEGELLEAPSQEELERFKTMFQERGFTNTKIGG